MCGQSIGEPVMTTVYQAAVSGSVGVIATGSSPVAPIRPLSGFRTRPTQESTPHVLVDPALRAGGGSPQPLGPEGGPGSISPHHVLNNAILALRDAIRLLGGGA